MVPSANPHINSFILLVLLLNLRPIRAEMDDFHLRVCVFLPLLVPINYFEANLNGEYVSCAVFWGVASSSKC